MEKVIFKISGMMEELKKCSESNKKELDSFKGVKTSEEYLNKAYRTNIATSEIATKLSKMARYKDVAVTAIKFSAKQKSHLARIKSNFPELNKQAVRYGIIDVNPRIVEMVKIAEATKGEPEIWQITEGAFNSIEPEFCTLLLEMVDTVNPGILNIDRIRGW